MDFAEELDSQLLDHLSQLRDDPEYRAVCEQDGPLNELELCAINSKPVKTLNCSVGRRKKEKCEYELNTTGPGYRNYFCNKHQQWIYDFYSSGKLVYVYGDGTSDTFEAYLDEKGFRKLRKV